MRRVLIVFYSHSGVTKKVAEQIALAVGADLFEIKEVNPYPKDYNAVLKQSKREIADGFQPEIQDGIPNVSAYDLIIAGSPNWWSTIAPPLASFLSQGRFAGKTIAPFITHGGGGLNRTISDIKKLCPDAVVLEGYDANRSKELLTWFETLQLTSNVK